MSKIGFDPFGGTDNPQRLEVVGVQRRRDLVQKELTQIRAHLQGWIQTPVSCCYFYKTPTYVMDREITFAALFYSMCNTVKSKFAQQISDVPCLIFDVFTMLLRGKCLQKSTCLQSEDLDDRLEDPGKAGKSGLSDTSASN